MTSDFQDSCIICMVCHGQMNCDRLKDSLLVTATHRSHTLVKYRLYRWPLGQTTVMDDANLAILSQYVRGDSVSGSTDVLLLQLTDTSDQKDCIMYRYAEGQSSRYNHQNSLTIESVILTNNPSPERSHRRPLSSSILEDCRRGGLHQRGSCRTRQSYPTHAS